MKKLVISCLLCFPLFGEAQQATSKVKNWRFHSINQVGLLNGQAGNFFTAQTINGFQRNTWFTGIGIGIDAYRFTGLPIFLDGRKEFPRLLKGLFAYGDLGVEINQVRSREKKQFLPGELVKMTNGFYSDAGLGFKTHIGGPHYFLFSIGYSYKHQKARVEDPSIAEPDGLPTIVKYDYQLGRLCLKMGWFF